MTRTNSALHGAVAKLTAMKAGDDSSETYQEWAPTYEADLIENYGYRAHQIAARALIEVLPSLNASIADLGCGTGLVAQELVQLGCTCIDGFDASSNMLAKAEAKRIYRHLHQMDLTNVQSLPDGEYDAAIAVGVFGAGHVGPEHLECFFRPVKSAGVVVLYANGLPFIEDDYMSYLRTLEDQGVCRVDSAQESNYMDKIVRPGWLVMAKRC